MKHLIIALLLIFSTTLTAQLVYDVREVYYSQQIGIDADEVEWIDVRDRDVKMVIDENQMHLTDRNGKRSKIRLISFDLVTDASMELIFRVDAEERYKDLKLVRQASVRDHMDSYKRGEISYSKMVSLINEDANKELRKKKVKNEKRRYKNRKLFITLGRNT